ncbi:MAG TPA: AgmX/PglI C-terminal domain-containing protein [Myxococcota bacterium]|nr:AgmX/PglI C-terminal domain-containing protein [Myxococcota bacterium]
MEIRLKGELRPNLLSTQDPMAVITTSGAGRGDLGLDTQAPLVLEVATAWGDTLLDVRHLDGSSGTVMLGTAEFPMPEELLPDSEPFELFSVEDGRLVANLEKAWPSSEHLSDSGDEGITGIRRVTLACEEQVAIRVGPITYVARLTAPGSKIPKGKADLDLPLVGTVTFSLFAAAMLAVVALTSPVAMSSDLNEVPDRFTQVLIQAPEVPKPAAVTKAKEVTREGERHIRKAGKRGDERGKMLRARGGGSTQDREIARDAGLMGAWSEIGATAGLDSTGLSAGIMDGVGGLIGAKGVMMGSGGFSSRGSGLGGGGKAYSGGGLGLEGIGQDARDFGEGALGERTEGTIKGIEGGLIVGGLDKAQVDKVIKRNLNRFRYCYQRELTKDPTIGGKVSVKFTITREGEVSAAQTKSSSVGNRAVESCLNSTMMKLTFPEPRGGGIVIVSYPFLFAPS